MSGFSDFLTNFNGGVNIDGSFNDLMSSAIIVPSFNTSYGHINDGFIFLSNMLIQFSGTNFTSYPLTTTTSPYYFKFPIDTSNNFIPYIVNVSTCVNSTNYSPVPKVNLNNPWSGSSFKTLNALFTGTNHPANITWFSIGPKPTTPIYTNTSNFTALRSIAINETGQIQYLCDGSTIKKNSSYGYGSWTTLNIGSSSNSEYWLQITCSYSGKYVGACRNSSTDNYVLSIDYGLTWNYYNDTTFAASITCSNNGIFYIFAKNGYIYKRDSSRTLIDTLENTGNYILTNNTNDYVYLVITNKIYRSKNDSSFNLIYTAESGNNFIEMATNRTGQYLAVCGGSSGVYISSDYGDSFSLKFTTNSTLKSITSNSTGEYLSVATTTLPDGGIYYSRDYGETWNKTNAPNISYSDNSKISMNSNGNIATLTTPTNVYVSFNACN